MMSASSPWSRKNSPIAHPEYGEMKSIGDGSEADAATTMVCSMAPFSSNVRTMLAMVDIFWPMAT